MSDQSKKTDSSQSNQAAQSGASQPAQARGTSQGPQVQGQALSGSAAPPNNPAYDVAAISQIIKNLFDGGVPGTGKADSKALKMKLEQRLAGVDAGCAWEYGRPDSITVAFPPCSDVMLSLAGAKSSKGNDDILGFFDDYFEFRMHRVLGGTHDQDCAVLRQSGNVLSDLDGTLSKKQRTCLEQDGALTNDGGAVAAALPGAAAPQTPPNTTKRASEPAWPPSWCFPPSCITLGGRRRLAELTSDSTRIRRLYVGDVLWLFYMERMGIFQILGAVLDDYTITGRLPISNGSLEPDVRDDIVALIVEAMTRQMETGNASTLRRRVSTYMRTLGWTLPQGRALGLGAEVHTGFNREFHELLRLALIYYRDKRLATAIRGTQSTDTTAATLKAISDRIDELKRGFESFQYGRNYSNALSGIVWAIGGMSVIRELASTLGIPAPGFQDPFEYIPAAYEILVERRATPTTRAVSRVNRYIAHRDCANNGRSILLDIEAIGNKEDGFVGPNGDLEPWLAIIEPEVEGYRGAYLALTGTDLGAQISATEPPIIEQQV